MKESFGTRGLGSIDRRKCGTGARGACRKKRNTLTYDKPEPVSPDEAVELVEKVKKFREVALMWLAANRPDVIPPPPPPAP